MAERRPIIGFSNLSEDIPFAVKVRESLQQAITAHGSLDLIVRDNRMDNDRALAHVQEFVDLPVSLAMIYHVDERFGPTLGNLLYRRRIPTIAIDIPIPPWSIYFGVNNQVSGSLVGEALGQWIQTHWSGSVDKVIVLTEPRVLEGVRHRLDYALASLSQHVRYLPSDILYVDCGNEREASAERVYSVLQRWTDSRRIAIIGFNDETAVGALDAARRLGREEDVAVVGQGANLAQAEFRNPNTHFVASTAYYPERYGAQLVDLAVRILNGEKVPRTNYIHHVCITAQNVQELLG